MNFGAVIRGVPAVVLVCVCASTWAQGPTPSIDLSKDKVLYGVSTMHLDTQWKWTIQDTIREYIPKTLLGQFGLMERYPHYTFSFEGAFRYMLAKEYYPREYEKLKHYVANGQWRVAGSSVDAGDTNVPSPESLFRQILYGNGFFRREFGKTSVDIFLPDCFGFGYALPSVAAHCGLKGFSTQKLSWGSAVDIPFDIGVWEGPDGASIVAALKPGDYISTADKDYTTDPDWIAKVESLGRNYGVYAAHKYFGAGDEGGALTPEQVYWLETSATSTKGPIRFVCAGSDQLYRDLTPEQVSRLPRYKGELVMTTHGVGCYTSHAAMKRWNRRNELLADAAERAAVAADWLGGLPYPKRELRDSWVRFLWHQFHDDLTGTSIPQAYTFSWNDELLSQNQFAGVLSNSAGAIARALDTRVKGPPVVVYNPLSIDRQDIVRARIAFPKGTPRALRVLGPNGEEVPSQIGATDGGKTEVLFVAEVPSVGWAVFDVRPADRACTLPTGLAVSADSVENRRYKVSIDANGDVAGVFDKLLQKELLRSPLKFELRRDNPEGFFSWEIPYKDIVAEPLGYVGGPAKVRIAENGPALVSLEVVRRSGDSTFVQRIGLAAGSAGDRVEIETLIDWKSRSTLVKAAFPFAASNPTATYDLGLGTIERGNNTRRRYEVPAQQWVDLTDSKGAYGVAVLSECKYGWDKPADDLLRLSIVRNPAAGHYEGINDVGSHRLTYALCGHKGDWRAGDVPWQAARINQPLYAFQPPKHTGALERSFSMLSVNPPSVAVRALKKAEDSDEIVIRLQELTGRAASNVRVSFARPIAAAREVTGDERPRGKAALENGVLLTDMAPYQPRTFALKLSPPKTRLTPPRCRVVALPHNLDVTSSDGEQLVNGIDGHGRAIPHELFPSALRCDGVTFKLGPSEPGERNATVCRGQRLPLRAARGSRLYLLAAAVGGDRNATFSVDGRSVTLNVQEYTGFIGQWNSRVVDGEMVTEIDVSKVKPGYYKPQPVAWVGTHRHNSRGENDPYVFCYLFRYRVDLPDGARSIVLPNDGAIRLFAATVARNPNDDTTPLQALVDAPFRVQE